MAASASEPVLAAAIERLPVAFALFDGERRLTAWNDRLAALELFPKRLLKRGSPLAGFLRFDPELKRGRNGRRELSLPDGRALGVSVSRIAPRHLLVSYEDLTAARIAEQRYDVAMRAINEGVYDWDIAKGTIYYSDRVQAATGMTARANRTPGDWRRRIHPDDLPEYDRRLVEHFKGRSERFECDYRFRALDGSWRWARQHGIAVRDASGRALRMIGSTGDISELKRVELALKKSEERYGLATRAATEGIYEWNLETGSLYLSERAKDFFAVAGDKFTPATWNARVHTDDFPGYRDALTAYFKGRTPQFEREYRIRNAAGGYAWVLDRAVGVRNGAGRVIRLVGALSDVTQRKLNELELRRARDEATEALERQTATAEILKVIARSPSDAQPVFDAIVKSALALCGALYANAFRYDGEKLHFMATELAADPARSRVADFEKFREAFVGALEAKYPMRPDASQASGRVILTRTIARIEDISQDKDYDASLGVTRLARRMLAVPMLRDGEPVGVIVVAWSEPGAIAEHHEALLRTFADQAVIAIENVRLFNETREALERQTATAEILRVISSSPTDVQPVFESIAERAATLCGAKFAFVTSFDGEWIHMRATHGPGAEEHRSGYPIRPGSGAIAARVIGNGATVQIEDMLADPEYAHKEAALRQGFRSGFGVPMVRDGQVLGCIAVTRPEPGAAPARLVGLLKTFADQAVIAIENVRLFNETKEALEEQTASAEILRLIGRTTSDLQPILDSVVTMSARLCNAQHAFFLRVDSDGLRPQAWFNVNPDYIAFRKANPIPLDDGHINGRVVSSRQPIHVHDVLADPSYPSVTGQRLGAYRTVLAVPVMRDREVVGTIAIFRQQVQPFTGTQVRMMSTFADQVAIAIENVRLFNETRDALERQTATAEILKVISGSPTDVAPVFDAIAERARVLCGASLGYTTRFDGEHMHLVGYHGVSSEAESAMRASFPRPPDPGSVNGRAILARAPVQIVDVDLDPDYGLNPQAKVAGYRSMLAVPMLQAGRPIGAVGVARPEPGAFSDKLVGLLQTFADQAVIAIENVRLFNETKETLERQTATAEILQVIASSPADVQPVLDAVASSAAALCEANDVVILLREGENLRYVAHRGDIESGMPVGETKRVGTDWSAGRAVLEGRQIHVDDILDESKALREGARMAGRTGHRTVLATPLLREGQAIGAIVMRRREVRRFEPKRVELINTFAAQAVIAIENVRLFNETKEALERQTATAEILRVISGSPTDVQPVFDAIVSSAVRLCDAVHSAAATVEGGMLHLAAVKNWTGEGLALAKRLFPMPVERDHLTAIAVRECRVIHSVNLQQDPDAPASSRELAIVTGYDALLIVPMVREGRAHGAVVVARRGPFSKDQIALLQTFADQAVIAIQNVRLFNETKEALERQTATAEILRVISSTPTDVQPVFEAIVESGLQIFSGTRVAIQLVEGDVMRGVASRGHSAQLPADLSVPRSRDSVSGIAVLDRAVVNVPDTEAPEAPKFAREYGRSRGFRSIAAAPLLREGEAIGVITVILKELGGLGDRQLALLKTFADQAVIAIENVRLFNETKEALERQTATAEILKVIASSPSDVQPVFESVAECAARLCETDTAYIFRFDGELLRGVVGYNASQELRDFVERNPIRPGRHSGAARAALERRTIHIHDVPSDPEYTYPAKGVDPIRTVLAVPMLKGDELLGVILTYRLRVKPFSDKQVALIETFADQAVIAIENVRLFNETREALERQKASAEVLSAISSSIADAKPVFDKILESCERLFAGKQVGVNLVGEDGLIHLGAYHGPGREQLERIFPLPIDRESGSGLSIVERRVIEYADIENDPGAPEPTRRGTLAIGCHSVIFAPMLWKDSGLGAIFVAREQRGRFSESEMALLRTFAEQAVIALENVRLFNETKEALEQQTATAEILRVISSTPTDVQPVFEAIVESGLQIFSGTSVGIMLSEGDRLRVVATRGEEAPLPTSLSVPITRDSASGRAFLDGKVVNFGDTEAPEAPRLARENGRAHGFRAIAAAPLIREGDAIGAINVVLRDAGGLSERQLSLLKTFADQAVIAIENVRLFNELQRRTEALSRSVEQLTALGEVGQAISSTLDLDTVLKTIVARAVQLSGLDAGVIYEYDEASEQFELRATENLDEATVAAFRQLAVRRGEGAVGTSVVSREPVQVPDIHDPRYPVRLREPLERSGLRALLAVPLLREEQIVGSLLVARASAGAFPAETLELLKTFASQSALAIQNARLFREIEEKGRQLEVASQHKSQFLASMSHELRTPLNAILGFNEMILGDVYGEVPEDMKEPLGDMQSSGRHLLRLINNVLDLAKIEAGRMELALSDYSAHDVVENVRATLRPLAESKGLELGTSVPADLPLAFGDAGRLTQCLMNLAGNSLKFTKEGRVDIVVELNGDGLLIYRVADTGIGIPEDKIGSLFTEFKQTDATIASEYGGTGLGLSITRKFIEMHGGRIWAESEIGKGSVFIFEIPLRAESA